MDVHGLRGARAVLAPEPPIAPRLGETVLFDPRSRTRVRTDLCFNIRRVDGWFARVNLQMLDAYGKFGPSFLMRNVYVGDRAVVRRSIEHLLGWDFDRIVVTHGDVLETGGREAFRAAWSDLKERSVAARTRSPLPCASTAAGVASDPCGETRTAT